MSLMVSLISLLACKSTEGLPLPGSSLDTAGIVLDDTNSSTEPLDSPVNDCLDRHETALDSSLGCAKGLRFGSVEAFFGLPYAKPPIGEKRWRRPEKADPWLGDFDATTNDIHCISIDESGLGVKGQEDCLTLNIFRPLDTQAGDDLPILFFTHGGSYRIGSGGEERYANDPLLAEDAILVTHNYRLGPLGLFAHPELTQEDSELFEGIGTSGNQGLFDSLMALEWVVENAHAIGGNEAKLTIFGESAGGMTTCSLLASPLAAGLFGSAIVQSAGCSWLEKPLSGPIDNGRSAEMDGLDYAMAIGCEGNQQLSCLREKSPELIVLYADPTHAFQPTIDGVFLSTPIQEHFENGDYNRVPVMAGVTENEGSLFNSATFVGDPFTLNALLLYGGETLGIEDTQTLLYLYNAWDYDSPKNAYDHFYADMFFVCPTREMLTAMSAYHQTYAYYFTQIPEWSTQIPAMYGWGSFHTAELEFVFGTNSFRYTPQEWELSKRMRRTWRTFADQSPSHDIFDDLPIFNEEAQGLENGGVWLEWNAAGDQIISGVRESHCDFFDAQLR